MKHRLFPWSLLIVVACGPPEAPDASEAAVSIAAPRVVRPSHLLSSPAGKALVLESLNGHASRGGRDSSTLDATSFSGPAFRPPTRALTPVVSSPPTPSFSPSSLPAGMTPGLMAVLSGQPVTSFSAIPVRSVAAEGPHLFEEESFSLASPSGGSASSLGGGRGLSAGGGGGGGGGRPTAVGGLSSGSYHVVRYACCQGLRVVDAPSSNATLVETLSESQEIWVTDLLPSTGVSAIIDEIDDCLKSGSTSCLDAVTQMAQLSNLNYYAEVYVPASRATGYAPIQSLFVRPVGAAAGSATLEVGFGKIAGALKQGIDGALNAGCGDLANTVTVQAPGGHDVYYDPTRKSQLTCDEALSCADWRTVSCGSLTSDDPLFADCIYDSADECGGARPHQDPASGHKYCVKNVCPGKSTCGVCREWFQQTGQDVSGWKTEEELVADCVQELHDQNPDGDIPNVCHGDPSCQDYCQQNLHTENVSGCLRYMPAGDSRSFADPKDYACGELPVGVTHPDYWYYPATGVWDGAPNYSKKMALEFNLFDEYHRVELERLPGQEPISFNTYDLTVKGNKAVNQPKELGNRNFWISTTPANIDLSTLDETLPAGVRPALRVDVCLHLPGLSVFGPDRNYPLGATPVSIIRGINFGTADIARTDLCLDGYGWLNSDLEPRLYWADASVALDVSYHDFKIRLGPGVALAAVATLVPVIGDALAGIMLAALAVEKIGEAIINNDSDWFENLILDAFETQIHDQVLSQVNDLTRSALADIHPEVDDHLDALCDKLSPSVPPSHPYYYFYAFIHDQCVKAKDSYSLQPFQANAGSAASGCYGTSKLYTPADAGTGRWWEQYVGQTWYFPLVPDGGCRIGNEVHANLDPAMWPVLRCGVASFNWWFHNGTAGFMPPPGVNGLAFITASSCSALGFNALQNLYGNGADLVDLYRSLHGGGGGPMLSGG